MTLFPSDCLADAIDYLCLLNRRVFLDQAVVSVTMEGDLHTHSLIHIYRSKYKT